MILGSLIGIVFIRNIFSSQKSQKENVNNIRDVELTTSSQAIIKKDLTSESVIKPVGTISNLDLTKYSDPFYSEPCFINLQNVCLTLFKIAGNTISFSSASQRPKTYEYYNYVLGRIALAPNSISNYYSNQSDEFLDSPYFIRIIRLLRASDYAKINPAFLFSYYDLIYQSFLNDDGINKKEAASPEIDAQIFANDFKNAYLSFTTQRPPNDDRNWQEISKLDWTNAGKASLFVAIKHLPLETVNQIFLEPMSIETRYQLLFSHPAEQLTLNALTGDLPINEILSIDPSENKSFVDCSIKGKSRYCYKSSENAFTCQESSGLMGYCNVLKDNYGIDF